METISWLDQVLATPIIGLRFEPNYKLFAKYEELLAPFLDLIAKNGEIRIARKDTSMRIIDSTGFQYYLKPDEIICAFKYQILEEKKGGSFPKQTPPAIENYSVLLERSWKEIFKLLSSFPKLSLKRIGIVATCDLTAIALPPGIKLYRDHLSAPWSQPLVASAGTQTALIKEGDDSRDLCHHSITFDTASAADDLDFVLDWQRIFKTPFEVDGDNIKSNGKNWTSEAIEYFNRFGSGGLTYA
jgi:hypothetical protein